MLGDKPIALRKSGPYTVIFDLPQPYASAERLFDSVAILPRHLLEQSYSEGKLPREWSLGTSPDRIAGLGPFCLKQYLAGQRVTLARNPYYWKADRRGRRLPYVDEITFLLAGNEDAEVLRFEANEIDVINRLSAENYGVLEGQQASHNFRLYDAGPSLEYNFVLLNLNSSLPSKSDGIRTKQTWFDNVTFRQALSLAIDREGMNRIIFQGRGSPIWTHVTPGNKIWMDNNVSHPARSLDQARALLKTAGFSWRTDGTLLDGRGNEVEFSVIVSASSNQRTQMATMLQQDLKQVGISVQVVPMEFRAMLDRVFQTHDYEAAVMGLGGGDVDPNSQLNVWLSSGDDHLWNLGETHPATPWEAEMDRLMKRQMSALSLKQRKALYDGVQEIEANEIPLVFLVSPHVLAGARSRVHNFKPAVLDPHTLWNSEQLFIVEGTATK
jgi:peptide/nickel transport system substrate-binding protein